MLGNHKSGLGCERASLGTLDQAPQVGQRRRPDSAGSHVCGQFIDDLLRQPGRQVGQVTAGLVAFHVGQTFGEFQFDLIAITTHCRIGRDHATGNPRW